MTNLWKNAIVIAALVAGGAFWHFSNEEDDKLLQMKIERETAETALTSLDAVFKKITHQFSYFDMAHCFQPASMPNGLQDDEALALDKLRKSALLLNPLHVVAQGKEMPKPQKNSFVVLMPEYRSSLFYKNLDRPCSGVVFERVLKGDWALDGWKQKKGALAVCVERYATFRYSIVYEELYYEAPSLKGDVFSPGETFGKLYLYEIGNNKPLGDTFVRAFSSEHPKMEFEREGESHQEAQARSYRQDVLDNLRAVIMEQWATALHWSDSQPG